jgi:hypothetical protein
MCHVFRAEDRTSTIMASLLMLFSVSFCFCLKKKNVLMRHKYKNNFDCLLKICFKKEKKNVL